MERQYSPEQCTPARTSIFFSKDELISALRQLTASSGTLLPDGKYSVSHPSNRRDKNWEIILSVDHEKED